MNKKVIGNAFLFPTYGIEGQLTEDQHQLAGRSIPFQRLGEVRLEGTQAQTTSISDSSSVPSNRKPLYLLGIPLNKLMRAYVHGVDQAGSGYREVWLGRSVT